MTSLFRDFFRLMLPSRKDRARLQKIQDEVKAKTETNLKLKDEIVASYDGERDWLRRWGEAHNGKNTA